jgi:hypothetical protein
LQKVAKLLLHEILKIPELKGPLPAKK